MLLSFLACFTPIDTGPQPAGGAAGTDGSVDEQIDQHQQESRNATQPCQEILAHDVLLLVYRIQFGGRRSRWRILGAWESALLFDCMLSSYEPTPLISIGRRRKRM
jgi:hypothetical protein